MGCTLTAVPRSTQPSTLQGTVNECSAYSSLQGDSKVKFAAWPTSWQPPGADRLSLRGPKMNSHKWLPTIDDSTINIVLGAGITIVIIITHVHS